MGRDKFVFHIGGKKRAAVHRLSPEFYEGVRHAFVDPDGWDELREEFRKRRTAILRGTRGQGRKAMAVRLLRSASIEVMYDLDRQADLNQLAEQIDQDQHVGRTLERCAGFLLCQPDHVDGRALRDLDDVLTKEDARLVLTVGPEMRLADEERNEYLVELPPAPSYRQIVERHLEWKLGSEAAQELLAREEVHALLNDRLNKVTSCEEAATLAFVLSEETGEAISVARVRERMARRSLDAFDAWFEDLRDLDQRSFAIALAVLDGLPYEDVARAAEKLRQRLDPPAQVLVMSRDSARPISRDRFRLPRRKMLELLRATVEETEIRRTYGWVPSETVRYKDRSYPRDVLTRIWTGYQIHDLLLEWLTELVEDENPLEGPSEIVVHVGTTIGVLSTFSFDHLRTAVLEEWAADDNLWKREAVAYALRAAAADERLRCCVTQLVNAWLGRKDDSALQATAARVHGVGLAGFNPKPSLAAFGRLARKADTRVDPRVVYAIGRSFSDLLVADPLLTSTALSTLLGWFDSPERADTAHLVFLMVAYDLVTDRAADKAGTASVAWPSLLDLAHSLPDLRGLLVRAWCRVLNEASHLDLDEESYLDLAKYAEYVVDDWARRAEGDQDLLDAFARMVRAVGTADPRARAILRRCAARWRSDDNLIPLPAAAHAVEAVLAG